MLDGVLNIYKEKGYTSHDVVAKMRGILRQKKIGHTGTRYKKNRKSKKGRPYGYLGPGRRGSSSCLSGSGNQAVRYADRSQ